MWTTTKVTAVVMALVVLPAYALPLEEYESSEFRGPPGAEPGVPPLTIHNPTAQFYNLLNQKHVEGMMQRNAYYEPESALSDSFETKDCHVYPNNTAFEPHFYSCSSNARPPILVIHDSAVSNSTGDYQFPLDFSQQIRFFFDVSSFATRRYDNMRAEIYLYRRKSGWLGCGWLFLPTFGLIDNYDVCEDNLSCPIYPGRQVIEVKFNPRLAFSGFLKVFHNRRVPYQFAIRLINNRSPFEELMCVVYQSRIIF